MKYDWVDSLFILNEQQREDCAKLEHYEVYFSMLRYEYIEESISISTMHDLWIFYYYEEKPLYNSELIMIYLLRHFVVDKVMKTAKFERIKKDTIGSYSKSLMAAALTLNIFLDCNRETFLQLPKSERTTMLKYSGSAKMLFATHGKHEDYYPRELVRIETKILKLMRQYLEENEQQFEQAIIKSIQFMDQYSLDEHDIFEKGILK